MSEQQEKIRVPCQRCGKTLFFYYAEEKKEESGCATIEIKCRNRECKEVNQVKICSTICQ